MNDEALERCQKAIQLYRDCIAKEQVIYGDEYTRLTEMESEGPAPDPCTARYNDMLSAIVAYDGDLDMLELDELREQVARELVRRI